MDADELRHFEEWQANNTRELQAEVCAAYAAARQAREVCKHDGRPCWCMRLAAVACALGHYERLARDAETIDDLKDMYEVVGGPDDDYSVGLSEPED